MAYYWKLLKATWLWLERGHPDSTLNRLRELPFITVLTMGFDRTETTLPDKNAADTVCN